MLRSITFGVPLKPLVAGLAGLFLQHAAAHAQLPRGWAAIGADTAVYRITLDATVAYAGRYSLRIEAPPDASGEMFAGAVQVVSPAPFRGHRIRLSAAGRTDHAGAAAIWLRVEGKVNGEPGLLAYDNMLPDRAIGGTTDWGGYEVVLDVPLDASAIAFGPLLLGAGRFWVDQFTMEEVAPSVPTTNQLVAPEPDAPVKRPTVTQPTNLGFEE